MLKVKVELETLKLDNRYLGRRRKVGYNSRKFKVELASVEKEVW